MPDDEDTRENQERLTRQLVVRVSETLYRALEDDARREGRIMAEHVRTLLRRAVL